MPRPIKPLSHAPVSLSNSHWLVPARRETKEQCRAAALASVRGRPITGEADGRGRGPLDFNPPSTGLLHCRGRARPPLRLSEGSERDAVSTDQ